LEEQVWFSGWGFMPQDIQLRLIQYFNTNFDELINDFIPRSSKIFMKKKNDELYALVLPFNNFKIGIPEALSKGMYNFNLLSRITRHVRHVRI
jgi:NTE family protein